MSAQSREQISSLTLESATSILNKPVIGAVVRRERTLRRPTERSWRRAFWAKSFSHPELAFHRSQFVESCSVLVDSICVFLPLTQYHDLNPISTPSKFARSILYEFGELTGYCHRQHAEHRDILR